ncbi:YggS family pyridoxal phosphate-dependent enzyme [Candidatus Pelagibacter communis]|uniref:YggS family pyridoxal phosphate-dependent enzyme n=1 Tax=Pelagibacter ubique TaxID=198252 RepID=UPI00094C17C5|nr:YggS family pyridoxal phosphate-dependent enzyme [Candidatus Pelagibacter ubique]
MTNIVESFKKIQLNINKISSDKKVNVIAVSKKFPITHIQPLLDYGHLHFGENKVQEAISKWTVIKKDNDNIKLHMVGKLQSNKAKDAVKLFDYIHSLDNQKLADTLAKNQINLGKELKYFIQVNIGNEIQKSGVPVNEIDSFYNYCINSAKLNVIGLMIIPPNDQQTKKYFQSINELNKSLALNELSMGMSADYPEAILHGSTFVRIGSSIFGPRS